MQVTFAYIFQHDILHLLHNQINCSFLLNLYSPAVCPKCRTVSHYLLQMRHTLLYKLVKTIWCMMSSSLRGNFNYLCCTFHSSALCLFLLMSSLGLSSIKDCLSRSWDAHGTWIISTNYWADQQNVYRSGQNAWKCF